MPRQWPRLMISLVMNLNGLPVVIVQPSCFAALTVAKTLIQVFGWSPDRIHLRTGQHDRRRAGSNEYAGVIPLLFSPPTTKISVITYGILWKWLTVGHSNAPDEEASPGSVIHRYIGIFLAPYVRFAETVLAQCP